MNTLIQKIEAALKDGYIKVLPGVYLEEEDTKIRMTTDTGISEVYDSVQDFFDTLDDSQVKDIESNLN